MFPDVAMYVNLKPTLITNTINTLCRKYVTITISNNLNLDAIARNSKAQIKVHKNTYSKQ
jgi:hypothetical protein